VGVKRISPQTLVRLEAGEFSQFFDEHYVIDCRFDYEYKGGHIKDAININTKKALTDMFYLQPSTRRVCVVFHCEFSSQRAPRACQFMRSTDRQLKGAAHYPELFYPDIYVVDGGYKNFFQQYPEMCIPQSYVEMRHPDFSESCNIQSAANEKEWGDSKGKPKQKGSSRSSRD
jgi:M-phase inducer tyrosine phosphatase